MGAIGGGSPTVPDLKVVTPAPSTRLETLVEDYRQDAHTRPVAFGPTCGSLELSHDPPTGRGARGVIETETRALCELRQRAVLQPRQRLTKEHSDR